VKIAGACCVDKITNEGVYVLFPPCPVTIQWNITQLDGRHLCIKTKPGEIIHAEIRREGKLLPFIKKVKDEGMPSLGNPFVRGDLYIAFEIIFPKELSPEAIDILRKVLPNPNIVEDIMDDDVELEEHYMDDADLSNFGKGGAVSSANEYDSDEEGNGAGRGVQCQQS
jgi:DnaJ family protein A protein 2